MGYHIKWQGLKSWKLESGEFLPANGLFVVWLYHKQRNFHMTETVLYNKTKHSSVLLKRRVKAF